MTGQLSDTQLAGYAACLSGWKVQDNPYPYGAATDQCKAWNAGYAAARTDIKLANRKAAKAAK